MKLDRNVNADGLGKYGLIKNRRLAELRVVNFGQLEDELSHAIHVLEKHGVIDWGTTPETEFFVMRLKDKYAGGALQVYANAALEDDPEYARDVFELAWRAGAGSSFVKRPD